MYITRISTNDLDIKYIYVCMYVCMYMYCMYVGHIYVGSLAVEYV